MRLFAGFAALLLTCACSPLSALNVLVPKQGFVLHAGIAYGEGERGKLDVYVPAEKASAPRAVIVFFYGGGWQSGRRQDHTFVAEAFTARGFVVVIPDYRVYPQASYPTFVGDGARAVAWTVDHASRYGGDPKRITLMGHSAGAHIAAMLAYNRRFLEARVRASVVSFVGLAGPYDFTPTEPAIQALLSAEGDSSQAMPARFVKGGEPPSLLVTGDDDTRVNPENTDRLERRLREVGSRVEVLRYPSKGHALVLVGLSAPLRDEGMVESIARFIRSQDPAH